MKLVIDINDKVYGLLRYFEESLGLNNKKDDSDDVKTALIRAVINGIPLEQYKNRQKMFSYLDGVADGLNELRRDTIDVLDKIRAEVENINVWGMRYNPDTDKDIKPQIVQKVKEHVIEIIDKYKAEIEPYDKKKGE